MGYPAIVQALQNELGVVGLATEALPNWLQMRRTPDLGFHREDSESEIPGLH